jgi:DNA processing protein
MKEKQDMIREFDPEELLGPLNDTEKLRCPRQLFVAGDASLFQINPRVSVVGSRKASPDGIRRAEKISRLLVERGAIVVSGLAEGIDTAAHRAAIEAGGKTIAVLGTPLDKTYPKSNLELQRKIIEEYAAVSQFPIGYPTQPKHFIMRNSTMALIVCASIIAEASDTSGALHQGWEALRLGRLLFIMESIFQTSLKWPNEMLRYGAQVLKNDNIDTFLDVLPTGKIGDDVLAF